eukprot:CAMPEP_0174350132 /NCGR_PEP_ID=MMETSP0811_2-20130205/7134_1 /TAXON_ID=73025 ORGANISM="Eutreptiella gymnastica-like, Strain CCMP1594" /NCGR_SAMPLE_ID=MMETSP0811_2 /ASSEMBLY_ACC=CAM_ASM_000667 /LENGTH=58 /DNA_ID=CAMNT_0015478171 /DNA_START=1791 /DNA_END=1964 /DNA_ORIENTATION=-
MTSRKERWASLRPGSNHGDGVILESAGGGWLQRGVTTPTYRRKIGMTYHSGNGIGKHP